MDEPKESQRFRRRKEARPDEIARAALQIFCKKGYAATRIEDVAALAGVSTGTVFVYFRSKEALFQSVVIKGLTAIADAIEGLTVSAKTPTEQMREFLEAWHRLVTEGERSRFLRLLAIEGAQFPDIADRSLRTIEQRARQLLIVILQKGMASGDFRPFEPGMVADIILSPFSVCTLEDAWKRNPSPHALLKVSFDILCNGLRAGMQSPGRSHLA